MRHDVHLLRKLAVQLALSCVAAPLLFGAPGKPIAASDPSKAPATPPEVSKSLFTMPTNPKEGRDPFFPNSVYPYSEFVVRTNKPVHVSALVLNGITPRRTAMINSRTFEKGEDADVKMPDGSRVHIKCIEIKDESAVIELEGGERQELRLRAGL